MEPVFSSPRRALKNKFLSFRESQKFYTITVKGFRPRAIEMEKWRYVTTIIVFVLPTLLALPLLILAWTSVLPYYMAPSLEAETRLCARVHPSNFFQESDSVQLTFQPGRCCIVSTED